MEHARLGGKNRSRGWTAAPHVQPDPKLYASAFEELAKELAVRREAAAPRAAEFRKQIEGCDRLRTLEIPCPRITDRAPPAYKTWRFLYQELEGLVWLSIHLGGDPAITTQFLAKNGNVTEGLKAQSLARKCVEAVSREACLWLVEAWREDPVKLPSRLRLALKRSSVVGTSLPSWSQVVKIIREECPGKFSQVANDSWAAVEECRVALTLLADQFSGKKRRPGRPRLKAEEERKRIALIRDWESHKDLGRKEFCKVRGIDVAYLETCINWNTQRAKRAGQEPA